MKKTSLEVEDKVVQLYLNGIKLTDIEDITNCKSIKHILKRRGIKRVRNPKDYNSNKKEQRNIKLIEDYLNNNIPILQICKKYNISDVNFYRILKLYNIKSDRNANNHWTIHKKIKENPETPGKFYILENYYGYTKIGITTKKEVKDRYRKNINVCYELNNTIKNCYDIEYRLKKLLKSHIPQDIDKTIDGWSECYNLNPEKVLEYVKSTVREIATI